MTKKPRQRRETWGAIRKLASGRFQASYLDPNGLLTDGGTVVRYSAPTTFDTKTDARAWLAARRAEIQDGTWRSPAEVAVAKERAAARVFEVYAADHIETRVNSRGELLKPSTRAEYKRLLAGPLKRFHGRPLDQITTDEVRRWNAAGVKSGKKTQTARAYFLLKSVLATAVEDGLIPSNPCQVKGAARASTGKRIEPPTDAELAIITATIGRYLKPGVEASEATAARIAPVLSLMVEVAAWGALRWGELTELRRGDISFDGETAVLGIARAVAYTKEDGYVVGAPKSVAGVRDVALPPSLTAPLRARLAEIGPRDDALVFGSLSDPSRHFSAGSFAQYFRAARAAAGRPDLPFHALRHFGLTRYALAGATTRELMARAGHSDVVVAMRYQHAVGRDADLARRMIDAGVGAEGGAA